MSKARILSLTLVFMLMTIIVASANIDKVMVDIKYIGFNENFGVHQLRVNISTTYPINVVYTENYYSIDSHGNPKFFSSGSSYQGVVDGTVSIIMNRPRHRFGQSYTLIEKVLTIDGVRKITWVDMRTNWKSWIKRHY